MSVEVADLVVHLRGDASTLGPMLSSAKAGLHDVEGAAKSGVSAVSGMGVAFGAMGIASAAAIGKSVEMANNYQKMLISIQGNTGMTNKELSDMSDGIKQMASSTGAPLDQLAEGFMKIHNFGFSSADSMKILKSAMESALSTGDNVAEVSNVMGVAMHEFNMKADDASKAMNVFHLAAQMSNATLGEFAHGFTKATNMAAALGVSLVDVAAAGSTLVQSGQTVIGASNGIASVMTTIIKPTVGATTALQTLSHETGVNLTRDFSTAGLRARGLAGVLDDVKAATQKMGTETTTQRQTLLDYAEQLDKNKVTGDKFSTAMAKMAKSIGDPQAAIMSIFPNVLAFREVMLLTTTQSDSFKTHLEALSEAMSGKLDPTGKAFAIQQQTMAASMSKLSETVDVLAINLGSVFLPIINSLLEKIAPILGLVGQWVQAHSQLTAAIMGGIAAFGLLAGGLSVLHMAIGPVAALLGGLSLPVLALVGAVAALSFAWSRDFGGIQEKTAAVWNAIQPLLRQLQAMVQGVADTFNKLGLGAAVTKAWGDVQVVWRQFTDWFGSTAFPALSAAFQKYGPVVWQWIQEETPKLLSAAGTMLDAFVGWLKGTYFPFLAQFLSGAASVLWQWIQDVTPVVLQKLAVWGSALGAWLKATGLPMLASALGAGASALWQWIQDVTPVVLKKLGEWGSALANWLKTTGLPLLATALRDGASALWQWVVDVTPVVLRKLGDWSGQLVQWLKTTGLPALAKALSDGAHALWDWIVANHQSVIDQFGKWKDALTNWIAHTGLPAIGKALSDGARVLWDWITSNHRPALDAIGKFKDALVDWLVKTGLPAVAKAFTDGAHVLWDWIGASAPKLLEAVNTWGDTAKSDFINAVKDAATWLRDAGKAVIQGLIDGVGDMKQGLQDKLGEITKLIPSWKGPLDTDLKLLVENGKAIITGLINGITSQEPVLMKALQSMTNTIVTVVKTGLNGGKDGGSVGGLGRILIDSLVKGIDGGINDVKAAAKKVADTAQAAVLGSENIGAGEASGSPSFLKAGQIIVKSVTEGVLQQTTTEAPVVQATYKTFGQQLTLSLQGGMLEGLGTTSTSKGGGFFGKYGLTVVNGLQGGISAALGTAKDWFTATGTTIADTITGGIVAGLGDDVKPIEGAFGDMAVKVVKDMSPTFNAAGKALASALGDGIVNTLPDYLKKTMAELAAITTTGLPPNPLMGTGSTASSGTPAASGPPAGWVTTPGGGITPAGPGTTASGPGQADGFIQAERANAFAQDPYLGPVGPQGGYQGNAWRDRYGNIVDASSPDVAYYGGPLPSGAAASGSVSGGTPVTGAGSSYVSGPFGKVTPLGGGGTKAATGSEVSGPVTNTSGTASNAVVNTSGTQVSGGSTITDPIAAAASNNNQTTIHLAVDSKIMASAVYRNLWQSMLHRVNLVPS